MAFEVDKVCVTACKQARTFARCSSRRCITNNCPHNSTSVLIYSTGKILVPFNFSASSKLLLPLKNLFLLPSHPPPPFIPSSPPTPTILSVSIPSNIFRLNGLDTRFLSPESSIISLAVTGSDQLMTLVWYCGFMGCRLWLNAETRRS